VGRRLLTTFAEKDARAVKVPERRLDLDATRALEAETIARAARLSPTPGGRHWAVLAAVLQLTTAWRKAADWLTVAAIARLAFGLDRDAHVTRHQWEDTTEALRMWTRRRVIRSKPPRGRPALERRRWWVCVDLDVQRTPTPGELAPLAPPDSGGASEVQLPPGWGETPPDPGGALLPPTPGDTPRSKRSQDSVPLASSSGDSRANGETADAGEPRSPEDELDDLTQRFARRISASRDRIGRHENRDAVAALITRHGTVLVRRWLDADHPLAHYPWPSDALEAAEAWIADATDPLAIPWDEETPL
jgi:hypothetical protein